MMQMVMGKGKVGLIANQGSNHEGVRNRPLHARRLAKCLPTAVPLFKVWRKE